MCCAVLSRSVMSNSCDFMDCGLPGTSGHGDSPGKNTGVGCHALLQEIFPTQGSKPVLLHCRKILYHLSHQRRPWILEWLAYPLSRGSSWPRKWITMCSLPLQPHLLLLLSTYWAPQPQPEKNMLFYSKSFCYCPCCPLSLDSTPSSFLTSTNFSFRLPCGITVPESFLTSLSVVRSLFPEHSL